MNYFFKVVDIFGRWDDDFKIIGVAFEVAPKHEFGGSHIDGGCGQGVCASKTPRTRIFDL